MTKQEFTPAQADVVHFISGQGGTTTLDAMKEDPMFKAYKNDGKALGRVIAGLSRMGIVKKMASGSYKLRARAMNGNGADTTAAPKRKARGPAKKAGRKGGRGSRSARTDARMSGPLPPPAGRLSLIEQELTTIKTQLGKLIEIWR